MYSCKNENSKPKINSHEGKSKLLNYDSIIISKSNEYVFLSFWTGMSDELFEKVAKIEEEKGNIKNKTFSFFINSNNYDTITLKIINNPSMERIELHYECYFLDGKYRVYDKELFGRKISKGVVCESKQMQKLLYKIAQVYNKKFNSIQIPVPVGDFVGGFEYEFEGMKLNLYKRWIGSNKVISLYYDTKYKELDAIYDADLINNEITNHGNITLNIQINYISKTLYERKRTEYENNRYKLEKNKKTSDSLNKIKLNNQLKNI